MLTTVRGLLTIAAIHGNPVAFGDCHSAYHQSPMPSESEQPVYVEPVPEAQIDSSKVCLSARKRFKASRFLHRLGVFTAHRKSTT